MKETLKQIAVKRIELALSQGVVVGSVWQHYKTKTKYVITGFSVFEEDYVALIHYTSTTSNGTPWARSLESFLSVADYETMERRFQKVD